MSDVQPPAAAQPPAGWYPDPQDAQQQRYWDGSTWTGHTAPGGAGAAAPTAAATMSGAALPAGDPAWQMPIGTPFAAKKAWYKRTWVLVVAAIVVVLVVLGVIGAVVGSDHSNALENSIKSSGQEQLQSEYQTQIPGATVVIDKVHCVEKGGTQTYDCLVDFTVTDPSSGQSQKFFQDVAGSCDSNSSCLWHTTDNPQIAPE